MRFQLLLIFGLALGTMLSAADDAAALARQARAVLSDACFKCHGPDEGHRKAKLRLDLAVGVSSVVTPHVLDTSELYTRITASDPDDHMPPPDSGVTLEEKDIALLKRWIEAGAPYNQHWSFVPLASAYPVPDTLQDSWAANTIDAFVLQRLLDEGLAPSPPADRESLLRRVYLDLTGLPPTVEAIDAFLADESDSAYEQIVDALLDSSAFGERMAVEWLDAARYADTFGYQSDVFMRVWPWRDWVINAFNEDLPYDQFLLWQLAGDLLPDPTEDQFIATAFNRLHRQTNEGGSIDEEFRVEYVADRTQTYATAVLGLTLECSRCHDHKFDPIAQREYYELSSFFANIDESGLYSHFTAATPTPTMPLYKDEAARQQHNDLLQEIDKQDRRTVSIAEQGNERFDTWRSTPESALTIAQPVQHLSFDEEGAVPESATLSGTLEWVPGHTGTAIRFSGEDGIEIESIGIFDRYDAFSFSLWLQPAEEMKHTIVFHRCVAESDAASRGYEFMLEEGRPTFGLIHFWPGNAIRVQAADPLPLNAWTHVGITYDGSSQASGIHIYVKGTEVETTVLRDKLSRTIRYEKEGSKPKLTLAKRFRDAGFKNGLIDEFQVFDRQLSDIEVALLAEDSGETSMPLDRGDEESLLQHFLLREDAPLQEARIKVYEARSAESHFIEDVPELMVMQEMPDPRPAYLLNRGQYDKPGETVHPDTPDAIFPFAESLPKNRLGLARWTIDPAHPLTARVAVNRFWQVFFGQGIVKTQEDFGSQGTPPSHPDLIDYLARDFIDSGWDVKALCKKIALSATYRQSSQASPELLEQDPENLLLARGPGHRLSAEQIRDAALSASGLLVKTIGGPSVKPYQPEGLWEETGSSTYTPDTGEGLHRRSLYTFIKRTVPPPTMATFDSPGREVCRMRRERTATPLQALVLLNDPQFVEAARALASHVLATSGTMSDAALTTVFRALTSRRPSERELEILRQAYREQYGYFENSPADAASYAALGALEDAPSGDPLELASLTALTQALMNHDDFQMKP